MDPLVTIVIPAYNVEEYIDECVESAIKQTYKNIEIIIINDGSTDNTKEKISKYTDEKVKIFSKENEGLSATRNLGINKANGKYIYFLDSDDKMDLNLIEACVRAAEENNLDIVNFDGEIFYDEENLIRKGDLIYNKSKYLKSEVMTGREYFKLSNNKNVYSSMVCLYFFKKSFLEENNLTFKKGILHEDELFTAVALILNCKVKYINKVFFYRRIRRDSIMTSKKTLKNSNGYLEVAEDLTKIVQRLDLDNETRELVISKIVNFYNSAIINSYKARINEKDKKEIIEFSKNLNYLLRRNILINNKALIIKAKFYNISYMIYYLKICIKSIIKKLIKKSRN